MQKWLLLLLTSCIITPAFTQKKKISVYDLDQINGLFYQRNTIGPFSGTAIEEHPNGKKKMSVPIKEGLFQGTIKEWAKDGTQIYEAVYNKGKQHGKETQWFATGQKKVELNFVDGLPDGTYIEWHKNGEKKSEGSFTMGKETGVHNWWYANGQLDQKASYTNGQTDGFLKNWFPNGQLRLESSYKDGNKNGKTQKWFENGQLKSTEYFTNDVLVDTAFYYSSKGILHTIRIYNSGRIIEEKIYRSASINVGDGYVQVYNEAESFFKVPIQGDRVKQVDMKNITYAKDGSIIQLFNIPLKKFRDSVNITEKNKAPLQAYIEYEARNLNIKEPNFKFDITQKELTTKNKLQAIHWHFESPSKFIEEQTDRTIQEEHYISILCQQQVLSIYAVVAKSDDPKKIQEMLYEIADAVELSEERIDLNQIISSLQD